MSETSLPVESRILLRRILRNGREGLDEVILRSRRRPWRIHLDTKTVHYIRGFITQVECFGSKATISETAEENKNNSNVDVGSDPLNNIALCCEMVVPSSSLITSLEMKG